MESSVSCSLCTPWGAWPNQRLSTDWLVGRQAADWLIRMRLCKQMPGGHGDIIGFEGILGDSPLQYISRANVLNR